MDDRLEKIDCAVRRARLDAYVFGAGAVLVSVVDGEVVIQRVDPELALAIKEESGTTLPDVDLSKVV